MPSNCPSDGPSEPKSGVAELIVFTSTFISEAFSDVAPWLLVVAGLVDAFTYDTVSECPDAPPAMPTSAELSLSNALAGPGTTEFDTWTTAVGDLLLNYAWNVYCQCVTGTATAPVYPAPPAGVGQPSGNTGTPCWSATTSFTNTPPYPTEGTFTDLGGLLLPSAGAPITHDIFSGFTSEMYPIPTGVTSLEVSVAWSDSFPGGQGTLAFQTVNGSSALEQVINIDTGGGTNPTVGSISSISGASTYWGVATDNGTFTSTDPVTMTITVSYFCTGSSPTEPVAPCCPPDPTLLTLVNQVWQLLQQIQTEIEALPSVPTSFVTSTVHSDLTGSGSFVPGVHCIAISIEIVTPAYGSGQEGSPTIYFDNGWVTFAAAEGNYAQRRIQQSPQLEQLPLLADTVYWSLSAGEVVTITELIAGT